MSTDSNIEKEEILKNKIFISSNIECLRKRNKLTQEKLGKLLGYKYTTIGNWENGIRIPDVVDLFRLSKIFNIATDDLIKKDLRMIKEEK